jgi:hypothetical protein
VPKLANTALVLTALLLLSSCSRQKTISADELRSDLTEAISVAAEAETFIGYVSQGRATANYAKGHIQYLTQEANRTAKELREAAPEASAKKVFPQSREYVESLVHEIATLRATIQDSQALAPSRQNISGIRNALEQAKAGL